MVGRVQVNGVSLRALFDTGASVSVVSEDAARRAHIDVKGPGVTPGGALLGFGRRPQPTWIAPVDSFDIGGERISHTRLRVSQMTLEGADMLLGADFFLSHHVYMANSQNRVYFTYNGGPVFQLQPQAPVPTAAPAPPSGQGVAAASAPEQSALAPAAPTDAEGFSRRGAAYAARHDYERALVDLDRACQLAPTQATYLRQRAEVRLALKQPSLAMADLDSALKLTPDDPQLHWMRAVLRTVGHDIPGARADLDAADRVAPTQADLRLSLGQLYLAQEAYEPAIAQLTLWIDAHSVDGRLGQALNSRCWARDLSGRDPDKALADCNAAVRLLPPHTAEVLDSRGLAHLRRGEWDRAIADYDAALAIRPLAAWSLYGRGVAETKKGLVAQGAADIAQAATINARLPELAKRIGVTP